MSCVSQARARAGQLLFLRRNDLRGHGLAGTCGLAGTDLLYPSLCSCQQTGLAGTDLLYPSPCSCQQKNRGTDTKGPSPCPPKNRGTDTKGPSPCPPSVPLFMPAEKQGDRHKRTVPMSPQKDRPHVPKDRPHVSMSPCLLRWTRFFDLEQVVNPGRKVFSQQSGGSDDDRHFSSGDDDHFALERPVHSFLRGLYRGDLFS